MNLELNERVVVITGGGGGIANAALRLFREEGAVVVTADLDTSTLSGADGITALELDLLEPGAPEQLVATAIEEHGRIDALVNSVGAGKVKEGFLGTDPESWGWHLDVNLMIAVRACHAALPAMIERRHGAIVNVTSEAGREPLSFFSEYSAAKAALISLSKCLSREFGPHGVRVNTVCPGTTRTGQVMKTMEEQFAVVWNVSTEEAVNRYAEERGAPLGRLAEPEEVARAILFLASDASAMTTGGEISVDGGARYAP